jgi:hypothetical protein
MPEYRLTEQDIAQLKRELERRERAAAYPNAVASPAAYDVRSNGPVFRTNPNPISGRSAD